MDVEREARELTIREMADKWFVSLGKDRKAKANVEWRDIAGWIQKFIVEVYEPAHDRRVRAQALRDAADVALSASIYDIEVLDKTVMFTRVELKQRIADELRRRADEEEAGNV